MKFYTRFKTEELEEAVSCHAEGGYKSVEEAVADTQSFNAEPLGTEVEVYDENRKLVHTFKIGYEQ